MGIVPCLHPDPCSHVNDLKRLEKFLEFSDPAAMKLCIDSSFLDQAGLPIAKFIKDNRKRIGVVHLRDIKPLPKKRKKGDLGPAFTTVELGKGTIDLEEFVDTLLDVEFSGWATVELEKGVKPLLQLATASHAYAAQTLDLVL